MNTSKRYLKEIRYRRAKCCKTCAFFVNDKQNDIHYCQVHDNPVDSHFVCKNHEVTKVTAAGVGEVKST